MQSITSHFNHVFPSFNGIWRRITTKFTIFHLSIFPSLEIWRHYHSATVKRWRWWYKISFVAELPRNSSTEFLVLSSQLNPKNNPYPPGPSATYVIVTYSTEESLVTFGNLEINFRWRKVRKICRKQVITVIILKLRNSDDRTNKRHTHPTIGKISSTTNLSIMRSQIDAWVFTVSPYTRTEKIYFMWIFLPNSQVVHHKSVFTATNRTRSCI